jgi:hypothetical protein
MAHALPVSETSRGIKGFDKGRPFLTIWEAAASQQSTDVSVSLENAFHVPTVKEVVG